MFCFSKIHFPDVEKVDWVNKVQYKKGETQIKCICLVYKFGGVVDILHMLCYVLCVQVLEQAWPFFGMFMEKLLKENIQASVRQSSPALKTFTFTKVHFGHVVSFYKQTHVIWK